jgi:hypothetical protein
VTSERVRPAVGPAEAAPTAGADPAAVSAGHRGLWVVIFFFASAGASAAYLTVSETWPIEIRSEAIAVFFTIGTIFGAIGPAFYGALIGNGSSRTGLFIGYLVGAAIMILGGVVELLIGINAEGKSLEAVTKPLTAAAE